MSSLRFALTIAALVGAVLILIWILILGVFSGREDEGSSASARSGYSSSASAGSGR
jgi:hypothetical protein